MNQQTIRLALLGHGTVGRSVRQILIEHSDRIREVIRQRTNRSIELELVGVLVKDLGKHKELRDATADAESLFGPEVDLVIELLGGLEPATGLIKQALAQGKDVVTANKQALFRAKGELEALAREHRVSLAYEGAVAGAVPILRSIRSLATGEITRIEGILNGSTNYILTQVAGGMPLEQALTEASQKGLLEADPTSDVEGFDAMYKLGILTYFATGHYPSDEQIERRGITGLSEAAIAQARAEHKKYKLIASADFKRQQYSIKPVAIGADHELYQVEGARNGITLWHEFAGELSFQGPGAGGFETASAVIGDLIDTVCHRLLRRQYD
ncbi:MAG TPA: homoserine dehydrogenase [Tissierellia bacterium]|nr:homoserine dehydrogenase [Tissierellia bacterium]